MPGRDPNEDKVRRELRPGRVLFSHDGAPDPRRTYVVLGSGRGGTTMVAACLRALGVEMGEETWNEEDPEIVGLAAGRDPITEAPLSTAAGGTMDQVRRVIRRRNAAFARWGWKDPNAYAYLDLIMDDLVNPCFLVIYRDMAAVAEREHVSSGSHLEFALHEVALRYYRINKLVSEWRRPTFIISYERAKNSPEKLVDDVTSFLELQTDPARKAKAMLVVNPEGGYR